MIMNPNCVTIAKNGLNFTVNAQNIHFLYFWNHIKGWEIETFRVFDRYLNRQYCYLDIGAWIGPTVLYAAHKAKHVYGLEPDPVAFQELVTNISLNPAIAGKVTCLQAALDGRSGNTKLYMRTRFGDSSSSTIPTLSNYFIETTAISINKLIADYQMNDINFIKIDIEAGEYTLIPKLYPFLKKNRPTLNLSLHPQFLNDHNHFMDDVHSTSDKDTRTLQLTKTLVESLEFYQYIYGPGGNQVSKDSILEITDYGMFTFTDDQW
ncbi:MAG TPA: FkbM family methyltransferase [Bacilli bacterium]